MGDVIPIESLKNKDGKTISQIYAGKLILLGIVDPECGACKLAKDQITWIQEDAQANDINYVLTSFTSTGSKEKFLEFTDSFRFPANTFQWSSPDQPPTSLRNFVVLSHLLIDSNGKILRKFPGTSQDYYVRRRMAKQITKEILQIKENLNIN